MILAIISDKVIVGAKNSIYSYNKNNLQKSLEYTGVTGYVTKIVPIKNG